MEPGQEWVGYLLIGGMAIAGLASMLFLWLKKRLNKWGSKYGIKFFGGEDPEEKE